MECSPEARRPLGIMGTAARLVPVMAAKEGDCRSSGGQRSYSSALLDLWWRVAEGKGFKDCDSGAARIAIVGLQGLR